MKTEVLSDSSSGFYVGNGEKGALHADLQKQGCSFPHGNREGGLIPLSQSTLAFSGGSMNKELL